MKHKLLDILKRLPRLIAGLWLSFMGLIASFMLYNEVFDPEWGRQAKQQFPEPPEWYILVIVAMAAVFCFYLAYLLIVPRRKMESETHKGSGESAG